MRCGTCGIEFPYKDYLALTGDVCGPPNNGTTWSLTKEEYRELNRIRHLNLFLTQDGDPDAS